MRWILWGVFALCLLAACGMDLRTREVYNFIWWISGAAAGILLFSNGRAQTGRLLELFVFYLIQVKIFSRMYGKADCYAFSVCAVAVASEGFGFTAFVTHMAIAFVMLAVVQLFSRNIDRRGNLKQAVPFLPYIMLSFVLLCFFLEVYSCTIS